MARNTYFTYFDKRYLLNGLALIDSLRRVGDASPVHVLALDIDTRDVLIALASKEIHIHCLEELETYDLELVNTKSNRKLVEYYFTLTSCFSNFLIKRDLIQEHSLLTYLDADLYFFSSTQPYFNEIGNASLAITPHNFPAHLQHLEKYGKYNVGILSWRNDEIGRACLQKYRTLCIDWCHDRLESNRFGDQKYLDTWPNDYPNLIEIKTSNVNISYWNVGNYRVSQRGGVFFLNDMPLICWHFSGFKEVSADEYAQRDGPDEILCKPLLIDFVFRPYARFLSITKKNLINQRLLTDHVEIPLR